MVSENEIQQQIDSYLKDENLELYDLNIVNFPNISKIEVFIYSVEDIAVRTYSAPVCWTYRPGKGNNDGDRTV